MMWVSRATENAAREAAERILDYHESHPEVDPDEDLRNDRLFFLEEQAKSIRDTNILFTIVSLGLFILSSAIILNNYRDTRKLGKRLDEAEEAARAAKKIAELKPSISSLLDNMPGLNFAKDAETGVYLACNQAFAVYADKEDPEGVIGHTDAELFDPGTASHFKEKDGSRLIVGVSNIDAYVRQEEEYSRRLQQAKSEADIDPLTGIKNRHAYLAAEKQLDLKISAGEAPEFAIVVFDLNDLKKVNDTQGHQAGDRFIRDACGIICGIFKRSPVFSIGGDEFSVIAQGDDYERIEELIRMVNEQNKAAIGTGGIVIACGMDRFREDESVARVYERADQRMYRNKISLKNHPQVLAAGE